MRILINITSDLYVRNQLQTGVLKPLEAAHECYYIADNRITLRHELEHSPFLHSFYTYPANKVKDHRYLMYLLMWKYRNLSSTFRFRANRRLYGFIYPNRYKHVTDYLKLVPRLALHVIRNRRFFFLFPLLTNAIVFPRFFSYYVRSKLAVVDSLRGIVRAICPDLIISISSVSSPADYDLIRLAREYDASTLMVIDNWDNISSKSIFWVKPDYLGVWGEQSRSDAHRIQGLPLERVANIGSARFDKYFALRNKELKSHFDFAYVLFAGFSMPFDELSALKVLDAEIEQNKELYQGTKILYRPHPWRERRQCDDQFREEEFKNVALDPQVKDQYYKLKDRNYETKKTAFQPPLDYYPSLLSNARFIVATPTTLMLEAAIFYKRIIALAYDDGYNFLNAKNAWHNYEHLKPMDRFDSIVRCDDICDLPLMFRKLYVSGTEVNQEQNDRVLKHIVYFDKRPYGERLKSLVDDIAATRGG